MIRKFGYYIGFFIIILLCNKALAQSAIGHIVDETTRPVENVSVIMQTIDSVFIEAAISDSVGSFKMKHVPPQYRLIFQHVLYEPFIGEYSTQQIGTVVLSEAANSLNEVIVNGDRPRVKVEKGALIYDIGSIAQKASASTAYEAIRLLPGVIERDDELSLLGTSGVTVMMNGRPSSMTADQLIQLLKSTPIDNVDRAEVMYSAPARMRVRGAVINIVLRSDKSASPKLRGEIGALYKQTKYANTKEHLSLSYSRERLSTDLLYSFGYRKEKTDFDINSHHTFEGEIYDILQNNVGYTEGTNHQLRLGADYKVGSEGNINMAYTFITSPNERGRRLTHGNLSQSVNLKKEKEYLHNLSLNFSSGSGLEAGVEYTSYNNPSNQKFSDDYPDEPQHFIANAKQHINRVNIYVGQTNALKNDWSINYGIKSSFAADKSSQIYHSLDGADMSSLNTNAKMNETTINFYAGAEKSFGEKLSGSISLAGEYYTRNNYEKWALYPTLQLNYTPCDGHIWQLSLSTNKEYPSYWEMQSTTSYISGYQKLVGNPNLRPSTEWSAQISYILQNKYMLNIYCNRINDYFIQSAYQSQKELSLIYQTINFNYQQSAGLTFVVPISIGSRINSDLTLDGGIYNEVCDNYHDIRFNRKRLQGAAILNNSIIVCDKPAITADLNVVYVSPSLQGIYDQSHVWMLDAAIKYTLAEGKAEIRLQADDLLDTARPLTRINYKSQDFTMKTKFDSRFISISFVYKFGGYETKKFKEIDRSRFGH